MRITPLEIKQKSFEKELRGFSKSEVTSFLQLLSQEWDRMLEESQKLNSEYDKSRAEIAKFREVEEALHRTLLQAEEQSKTTVDNANKTAELTIKEAKIKASTIVKDAEDKAAHLAEEAEQKLKDMISTVQNEKKIVERELITLSQKRDDFVFQTKSLLTLALDQITRLENINIPIVPHSLDPVILATRQGVQKNVENKSNFEVTNETFKSAMPDKVEPSKTGNLDTLVSSPAKDSFFDTLD